MTVFHYQNHVCWLDCRKSVCNNKTCSSFHKLIKCILYLDFSSRINRRCRLIKNKHRWMTKHNSCYTQKLFLSLWKAAAIFTYYCIITIWKSFYESVWMSCLCRFNYFFLCCIRPTHYNIFTDCTTFKPRILQNHSIARPEWTSCKLPYINTRHIYWAAVYIIKSHKEVDNCCFTTSCRSYNGNFLTFFYMKIKIFNKLFIRDIWKFYII